MRTFWNSILCLLLVVLVSALLGRAMWLNIAWKNETAELAWMNLERQYEFKFMLLPEVRRAAARLSDPSLDVIRDSRKNEARYWDKFVTSPRHSKVKLAAMCDLEGSFIALLSHIENNYLVRNSDDPEFQADRDLLAAVATAEQRIAYARKIYNGAVRDYNGTAHGLIRAWGFQEKPYFSETIMSARAQVAAGTL